MEFLPNGSGDDNGYLTPYGDNPIITEGARQSYIPVNSASEPTDRKVQVGRLVRRYWLLLFLFLILGAAGGFVSVVLSSPRYRTRLLLEVEGVSGSFTKMGGLDFSNLEGTEINIQTQINILRSASFKRRGADRLQQDSVPLAPTGKDIFSRLRQRVHPATQDPIENAKEGLAVAFGTFNAQPVAKTRLIELSCESSSPDVAAQFLNSMAEEFKDDTNKTRMQASQHTSEWLAASIEETRSKMQEAEEHLREFVAASGNVFAGQENTLNDSKLAELKAQLAGIQHDLVLKQTRYEVVKNNPPETLADVLGDPGLKSYQQQIEGLKRDRAALTTTFTAAHPKVKELDAKLQALQKSYQNEMHGVMDRVTSEYEVAKRQEKLLSSNYASQASRVGSEQAKAAQYAALKREAETLHQVYQSLLMQQSETGLSSSVPMNPIRIVEPAAPPDLPYKPQPVLNISFGCLLGAVLAGGLAFLKEKTDNSIKAPGMARRLFNTPELGVIPNLALSGDGGGAWRALSNGKLGTNGNGEEAAAALMTWQNGPSFITESFRGTLASILRNQSNGKHQRTILITSPGPSEGKTTVIQNLGIALAETGRRVLLVDGDFRRPHLHRKFGLPNESGMIDLLSEERPLREYPPERFGVATGFPGLWLLANGSGPHQANISRALYSPRLREIFELLTRRYDMVLVDAPPILHVADARIIAPLADALILVLRCGVTDRASAMEAYQRIQEDGLSLLGTVLTDYDIATDRKRQYYYDYGDPSRA